VTSTIVFTEMPSVAGLVKRLRESFALTQHQLAESAGIAEKELHLLESDSAVTLETKIRVLMDLQKRMEDIQEGRAVLHQASLPPAA